MHDAHGAKIEEFRGDGRLLRRNNGACANMALFADDANEALREEICTRSAVEEL